jgi:hypothetical protein
MTVPPADEQNKQRFYSVLEGQDLKHYSGFNHLKL